MLVTMKVVMGSSEGFKLAPIHFEQVRVGFDSILSIDGSTTRTGVSILRKSDGALQYVGALTREDKVETPVQYKTKLKRVIKEILYNNKAIDIVYYEEPFIGYASSVKNLMMLRTSVEELIAENEPDLDYVKVIEVPNKKWKRLFLAPDKTPVGTELEKAAIKEKLLKSLPFLKDVSQDEIDATAMGYIATVLISKGTEEELEAKKKPKPFKYGVQFIGANEDDDFLEELMIGYSGPKKPLENGASIRELKQRESFEKSLYESMDNEDKVVILKFSSNTHGNVVLEHKLGAMSSEYEYIYGVCWRLSRK